VIVGAIHATPTDPFIALRNVTVVDGSPTILRVEGSFHSEDLAQVPFPLQILVRELTSGTQYVRIDPMAGAVKGDDPALSDGLQIDDVAGLLAGGSPEPAAQVVELSEERIDFVLPDWFPLGPAQVQLFVWNEGDPVLSNPLPVAVGVGDAR
jgi:hypothetical protein